MSKSESHIEGGGANAGLLSLMLSLVQQQQQFCYCKALCASNQTRAYEGRLMLTISARGTHCSSRISAGPAGIRSPAHTCTAECTGAAA